MANFIELTNRHTEEKMLINVDTIESIVNGNGGCDILPVSYNKETNSTAIYEVVESYDEVSEIIKGKFGYTVA